MNLTTKNKPEPKNLSSMQTDEIGQIDGAVIKKIADIPKEYKCCRCKKDLRIDEKKGGCDCVKSHTFTASKSGGQFLRTIIEYRGKDRFGNDC